MLKHRPVAFITSVQKLKIHSFNYNKNLQTPAGKNGILITTYSYCLGGGCPQVNNFKDMEVRARAGRGPISDIEGGGVRIRAGRGECTVRSNTSWVMVTWGTL